MPRVRTSGRASICQTALTRSTSASVSRPPIISCQRRLWVRRDLVEEDGFWWSCPQMFSGFLKHVKIVNVVLQWCIFCRQALSIHTLQILTTAKVITLITYQCKHISMHGGMSHMAWFMEWENMFRTKNQNLSVKTRDGKLWGGDEKGYPRIYAVGDCNYSCVDEPGKKPDEWPLPPIPKISYPGEEMCIVACSNIEKTDRLLFQNKTVDCCGEPLHVWDLHWPWGAGMFATSLGPDDACFVAGANWQKNSGLMCVWGQVCAVQKEFIEASKTDECAYGSLDLYWMSILAPTWRDDPIWQSIFQMGWNNLKPPTTVVDFSYHPGFIGRCIWYFVHHTPVHLFGGGPRWGYWRNKRLQIW